jgi:SAM-dependent methyltransferase
MPYTIDERNRERQQLLEAMTAPITRRLLDSLALKPDSRCLDLACGIGQTTRLIATYLGPQGECVGVDQDPALIETARTGPPAKARLAFQTADASALPFDASSFDFVFTRYLLIHVPDPLAVLREMHRVARPGGIVAVQEPDNAYQCTDPESWAFPRLIQVFEALFAHACIGRNLVSLFREAGLKPRGATAELPIEFEGSNGKRLFRLTAEAMGPAILSRGIMSAQEFRKFCAELRRLEDDPTIVWLSHPLVSVWAVA